MSKIKQNLKMLTAGAVLGGVLFSGVSYAASATNIDVYFQPLKYFFDGVEKKSPADQQGFIYQGTTYVPLRFVSEALGKEVGYDGPTSSIYVGKQKENTTPLGEIKTLTATDLHVLKADNFTSNVGDKFIHGYLIGWDKDIFVNRPYDGSLTYEYLLNGNYTKFEALLAPENSWSTSAKNDNIGNIKIYGDDKLIYESGPVSSTLTSPISINVNLKGILKLKIQAEGKALGLLEPRLTN